MLGESAPDSSSPGEHGGSLFVSTPREDSSGTGSTDQNRLLRTGFSACARAWGTLGLRGLSREHPAVNAAFFLRHGGMPSGTTAHPRWESSRSRRRRVLIGFVSQGLLPPGLQSGLVLEAEGRWDPPIACPSAVVHPGGWRHRRTCRPAPGLTRDLGSVSVLVGVTPLGPEAQ